MAISIFRYPGGKLKAIKFIRPFWNQIEHDEYREPFVGGGSVYIAKEPVQFNWINDLDNDLIAFYKVISDDKERKNIAERGKIKYTKYFNSNLVANYIVEKTYPIKSKTNYLWDK